jgi:hypothetical protein
MLQEIKNQCISINDEYNAFTNLFDKNNKKTDDVIDAFIEYTILFLPSHRMSLRGKSD